MPDSRLPGIWSSIFDAVESASQNGHLTVMGTNEDASPYSTMNLIDNIHKRVADELKKDKDDIDTVLLWTLKKISHQFVDNLVNYMKFKGLSDIEEQFIRDIVELTISDPKLGVGENGSRKLDLEDQ